MKISLNLIINYTDNIYILGSIIALDKAVKNQDYCYAKKMINRICRWYDNEIKIICHKIKDATRQQFLDTHGVLFDYKAYLNHCK